MEDIQFQNGKENDLLCEAGEVVESNSNGESMFNMDRNSCAEIAFRYNTVNNEGATSMRNDLHFLLCWDILRIL